MTTIKTKTATATEIARVRGNDERLLGLELDLKIVEMNLSFF